MLLLKGKSRKSLGTGRNLLANINSEIYPITFSSENTYLDIADHILINFVKYHPLCRVEIIVSDEELKEDTIPEDDGITVKFRFEKVLKSYRFRERSLLIDEKHLIHRNKLYNYIIDKVVHIFDKEVFDFYLFGSKLYVNDYEHIIIINLENYSVETIKTSHIIFEIISTELCITINQEDNTNSLYNFLMGEITYNFDNTYIEYVVVIENYLYLTKNDRSATKLNLDTLEEENIEGFEYIEINDNYKFKIISYPKIRDLSNPEFSITLDSYYCYFFIDENIMLKYNSEGLIQTYNVLTQENKFILDFNNRISIHKVNNQFYVEYLSRIIKIEVS